MQRVGIGGAMQISEVCRLLCVWKEGWFCHDVNSYLPGTEDTMISKVVPPGRGLFICTPNGLTPATTPNRGGSSA